MSFNITLHWHTKNKSRELWMEINTKMSTQLREEYQRHKNLFKVLIEGGVEEKLDQSKDEDEKKEVSRHVY